MTQEEFYEEVENQLDLNSVERIALREEFKVSVFDSEDNETDVFDGSDLCDFFEREMRYNRFRLNNIISDYVSSNAKSTN